MHPTPSAASSSHHGTRGTPTTSALRWRVHTRQHRIWTGWHISFCLAGLPTSCRQHRSRKRPQGTRVHAFGPWRGPSSTSGWPLIAQSGPTRKPPIVTTPVGTTGWTSSDTTDCPSQSSSYRHTRARPISYGYMIVPSTTRIPLRPPSAKSSGAASSLLLELIERSRTGCKRTPGTAVAARSCRLTATPEFLLSGKPTRHREAT